MIVEIADALTVQGFYVLRPIKGYAFITQWSHAQRDIAEEH